MKKSIKDDIRRLLPELFDPADQRKERPDGMCTPESGCVPGREAPATDIVRFLSKNRSAGTAGLSKGKESHQNHDPG